MSKNGNGNQLKHHLHELQVVSLFCGSGGLDLGFANAGFRSVLAMDIDQAACLTYEKNHVLKKDLSQIDAHYVIERLSEFPEEPRPIGIIGGPPCQAFSMSNVHKDSDDPRAKLPEK